MKNRWMMAGVAALTATMMFGTMFSAAQDRGGRNFDPERMREMIMSRMQEQLDASDDEWTVLAPKIEKVWELQRETRAGGMGRGFFGPPPGFGGPGGPGGPDGPRGEARGEGRGGRFGRGGGFGPEPSPEMEALQTVLENENAPADDIQAKLKAYREARDKKEAELKTAREELRQLLTIRQEAMLVMMGTLE